jgi:FMN phosphatase YigB (HAD superfamily)
LPGFTETSLDAQDAWHIGDSFKQDYQAAKAADESNLAGAY